MDVRFVEICFNAYKCCFQNIRRATDTGQARRVGRPSKAHPSNSGRKSLSHHVDAVSWLALCTGRRLFVGVVSAFCRAYAVVVVASSVLLSDDDAVVPSDDDAVVLSDADAVVLSDPDAVADPDVVVVSDADAVVLCDADAVVTSDADAVVSSDADAVVPSDAEAVVPSDADAVVPSDADVVIPSDAVTAPVSVVVVEVVAAVVVALVAVLAVRDDTTMGIVPPLANDAIQTPVSGEQDRSSCATYGRLVCPPISDSKYHRPLWKLSVYSVLLGPSLAYVCLHL